MINLGDKVKDSLTGLVGIVAGKSEFLNGCIRYMVQPSGLHEGKPIDASWIDEPQLEVIKSAKPRVAAAVGGPRPNPTRHSDPR